MQRSLNQLSADASVSGGTEPQVRLYLSILACPIDDGSDGGFVAVHCGCAALGHVHHTAGS